ncbi:MAG: DUF4976 domain-containing protein, partial [Planctomycetales bacterium]|nr:DUF4976 domain-containing protein [Planctomycetales bacterium]
FWHKLSLFEESARVPMVMYAPGMKAAGKPCSQLVELIDLYPTLTRLCGLDVPGGLDGADIAPLLDDPSQAVKEAAYTVVSRTTHAEADHARHMSFLGRTVRTDRWRYTEWEDGKRGTELYNEKDDPRELNNLAENQGYAEVQQHLQQLISLSQAQ